MEQILKTVDLTKTYSGKNAVSGVSMTINKGDIYGFIGRNGAGKTTLIKTVVGLSLPTSGTIELFGNSDLNAGRMKIGTVIESPAFMPHLSARENLKIQWLMMGGKDESIIDESLKLVGLENVGKKHVKKFSLGMKQRLGIAITLMGEPEFLILDEPINGLDPEGIIEVRNMIKHLNEEKGLTVLISSHILGELAKLATRYGIINEGKLIDEFTADELHSRCKSALIIKVDDVKRACDVLKNSLNAKDFNVLNDNTIELFDMIEDSGFVNSTLSKNEVTVESISYKNADLEEYFMEAIGGKNND